MEESEFKSAMDFLKGFKPKYNEEVGKLPYHINLIDELHANENAHSRILVKLLKQCDPITKKYELLESFIKYIIEKNSNFQNIKIEKPTITQKTAHIDLWIRDISYAIIIENKVAWAVDREKQIAGYIDITKHNYAEENIYVLYLPPTYQKKPEEQSWGKYYETDIYKKRYLLLSFKDDILLWLKDSILPNLKLKDKYLSSAVEQYIDHLEGIFGLRTIYKKMNMELQEFVKEKLELTKEPTEKAIEILTEKEEELNNALTQIQLLKKEYHKQNGINHFTKWREELKKDFPDYKIIGDKDICNVGLKFSINNQDFEAMLEYTNFNQAICYFGIRSCFQNKSTDAPSEILQQIIAENKVTEDPDGCWYGCQYISLEDAYSNFKNFIEKLKEPLKR